MSECLNCRNEKGDTPNSLFNTIKMCNACAERCSQFKNLDGTEPKGCSLLNPTQKSKNATKKLETLVLIRKAQQERVINNLKKRKAQIDAFKAVFAYNKYGEYPKVPSHIIKP